MPLSDKIFQFLDQLDKNNNRDWFSNNKDYFQEVQNEVKSVMSSIFENLNGHDKVDKMNLFRIYRDVRFSKDKTPYKTHFGCTFHRLKPNLRGGYYVHISPKEPFLAVGFWNPEKQDLLRIRKEIEYDAVTLKNIIEKPSFKNIWGEMQGDSLKTRPKGFDKNHSDISLIRKKQFFFKKELSQKEVLSKDFVAQVNASFKSVRPFFNLMSDVLTTNLDGEPLN